jgi:NADP-dependent 3-hydroxy acid dehydrogenase YdfG
VTGSTAKHAVVTGGGSGVGRAVAIRLAREGWHVAVLGRRAAPLHETEALARGDAVIVAPCDVADAAAVAKVRDRILAAWGGVDVVVAAAGTNVVRRSLPELSVGDFQHIVGVNLAGLFNVVHAFLPSMRARGAGTIVPIVSDAGLIANAKGGGSYAASKFGANGLSEAINAELRGEGIRCCAIFPGDIDTPLLEKRPVPPGPEARARMLQPDDVAECVMLAINLPPRVIVEKLLVRPA